MYISIEQAMDVYNELIDAKNGEHITKISIYMMMPNSLYYSIEQNESNFDVEKLLLEKKLAEDFHSICRIFSKKHHVSIFVNEAELEVWIKMVRNDESRFCHTVLIEVKKL